MHVKYDTKGICAVRVEFDVEDGVVKNISFLGGCDGNHKGLAALAEGMTPEEVARRLKGITCGRRSTSCPDQLAVALEEFMKNQ
ncbi:MAG: TIGR03905 family TSCPD domain-containing protein [Anaerotignum sp.]|nr:TIGR03905 family TSCPD domain-containing protein [Anaerotignum sp.]